MDKHALALRKLCDSRGGYFKVAEAIDANPQTLHQIISGVKLPSGNPRGVGPNLRKRLDAAFPGWADVPQKGAVFHELTEDEFILLDNFRHLTDELQQKYSTEIAEHAAELARYIAKFVDPVKNGKKVKP